MKKILWVFLAVLFSSCGCGTGPYRYSVTLKYQGWIDETYLSDSIEKAGSNYIIFYKETGSLYQHIGPYEITYNKTTK